MRYRVPALVLVLLVAAGRGPLTTSQAQTCSQCTPSRISGFTTQTGTKKVCFDAPFTAEEEGAIKDGIAYTNMVLAGNYAFNVASPGDTENCNILIQLGYQLVGSTTAGQSVVGLNSGNGWVYFNPDYVGTTSLDFLEYVGAHEFFHMAGFDDYPEGDPRRASCDGLSLMAGVYPGHPGVPSGVMCGDEPAVASVYPKDNDHDGYSSPGDDCNDEANWINPGVGDPPPCGHTGDWNCNGIQDETECATPVVVDVLGNGIDLTDNAAGVQFDFDGDHSPEQVSWTAVGSDDAWLVLDRNGNGRIDNGAELFGNWTPQPSSSERNGFSALALFDGPTVGGNANGWFDAGDRDFDRVRLWRDSNHDGVSQPDELLTLQSVGLKGVSLEFTESRRRDQWGNWFRYRARLVDEKSGDLGKFAYDVFLLTTPGRIRPAAKPR